MTGGSERETRAVRPSLTSCFPLALIVVFCKRRSVWPSEECHVFLLTHRDIYVNVGGNRFLGTYRDQNGALFDQLQGYGLELIWRIPAAGMNAAKGTLGWAGWGIFGATKMPPERANCPDTDPIALSTSVRHSTFWSHRSQAPPIGPTRRGAG